MRGGTLRRQPAFTGVAILTLALGIGTTTAVFTIVNGVLLRPLPYHDPGRLVMLFYGHSGRVSPWLSPLNVRDYVGPSEAFAGASAVVPITVNMTGLGDPERLQGAKVSWNYFKPSLHERSQRYHRLPSRRSGGAGLSIDADGLNADRQS